MLNYNILKSKWHKHKENLQMYQSIESDSDDIWCSDQYKSDCSENHTKDEKEKPDIRLDNLLTKWSKFKKLLNIPEFGELWSLKDFLSGTIIMI